MTKNDATEKMIHALSVLEQSNLIWTKKDNAYFWGTEDGKPTDVFLKTIRSLENKGFAAIVYQMDRITVNITESGKTFLLKCRREEQREEYRKKIEKPETVIEENMFSSEETVVNHELLETFSDENLSSVQILPSTVYLIDSENVGNTWLGLISRLQEEDELHVFYTDKSPTLTYETVVRLLEHDYIGMVNWIKCFTGENALDFQLVTELGSMIAERKYAGIFDTYFIILSRDRGYDPVVSYWTKKGVMIKRYSAYTDIRDDLNKHKGNLADDFFENKTDEENEREQFSQKKKEISDLQKRNVPFQVSPSTNYIINETKRTLRGKRAISALDGLLKEKTWKEKLEDFFSEKVQVNDPKAAAEYLIEMSRLINVNNEEKYLHAISTQFGDENGKIIMDEIQQDNFLRINLSNGPIKNLKIRRKDYIMLFLRNNEFLDPDIRSIAPLLQKPSSVQMENIKQLLLRYHNSTETQELMLLIQKHLKIVKEIV